MTESCRTKDQLLIDRKKTYKFASHKVKYNWNWKNFFLWEVFIFFQYPPLFFFFSETKFQIRNRIPNLLLFSELSRIKKIRTHYVLRKYFFQENIYPTNITEEVKETANEFHLRCCAADATVSLILKGSPIFQFFLYLYFSHFLNKLFID